MPRSLPGTPPITAGCAMTSSSARGPLPAGPGPVGAEQQPYGAGAAGLSRRHHTSARCPRYPEQSGDSSEPLSSLRKVFITSVNPDQH